jgi:phosphinothricin acetyltransferase
MRKLDLDVVVRNATQADISAIARIYAQGVEDRIATLESETKSEEEIAAWLFADSTGRYPVVVAAADGEVIGWAAVRPYSHRCAYQGVGDLSIYVAREARGKGVGGLLMAALEARAADCDIHKIVLFALAENHAGRALYDKCGFREVGVFREHGILDGRLRDVIAMEKVL